MIRVPYGKRPSESIERIEGGGMTLYMRKLGSLTPNERPPAMQELESAVRELQQLWLLIAENIQGDYPVALGWAYYRAQRLNPRRRGKDRTIHQVSLASKVAARAETIKLASSSIPLNAGDWLKFDGVDAVVVVTDTPESSESRADAKLKAGKINQIEYSQEILELNTYKIEAIGQPIKKDAVGTRIDLRLADYASEDDIARVNELNELAPDVAIQAATLFMQYRVLFPIEGVEEVKANAEFIRVTQLNVDLQIGDRIKFPGSNGDRTVYVTLADAYEPSDNEDKYIDLKVEKCPGPIKAGTTGYLMDRNRLSVGIAKWDENETRNLSDELIAAIYKFHQAEANPPKGDDETVGKSTAEKSSNRSGASNQLTGANTTGESSLTASTTSDSQPTTLGVVPAA